MPANKTVDVNAGELHELVDQQGLSRSLLRSLGNLFLFLLPIAAFLTIWHIATVIAQWPNYLLPGPAVVAETFVELLLSGLLLEYLAASVGRLMIGCLAGFILAVPLGYAIGSLRIADRAFSPIVSLLQPIPGIAWIPLAILWFGLGPTAVGFIIFLAAFFPILLNTVTGVRTITGDLMRVGHVFQFPTRMMVLDIVLPGALPYIVTGTRLGFGYGWRALVAGEMIAASSGLGFMIFEARNFLKTDEVIVGMLTIGLFWAAVERVVLRPIEKRTIERWGTAKAAA
jgi:ABC-type nitrate/sulfonate/bicarbonate transport system permease component